MAKRTTDRKHQGWGIIRRIAVPGAFPDEDPCAFDGWYFIKAWAQAIYDDWCERYPDWDIALVRQEQMRSERVRAPASEGLSKHTRIAQPEVKNGPKNRPGN